MLIASSARTSPRRLVASDGRSDVRDSTLRQLLLEIAPVLLTVDQPDVLSLTELELEKPETVVEVGR
jgi:hypothetical protein